MISGLWSLNVLLLLAFGIFDLIGEDKGKNSQDFCTNLFLERCFNLSIKTFGIFPSTIGNP